MGRRNEAQEPDGQAKLPTLSSVLFIPPQVGCWQENRLTTLVPDSDLVWLTQGRMLSVHRCQVIWSWTEQRDCTFVVGSRHFGIIPS